MLYIFYYSKVFKFGTFNFKTYQLFQAKPIQISCSLFTSTLVTIFYISLNFLLNSNMITNIKMILFATISIHLYRIISRMYSWRGKFFFNWNRDLKLRDSSPYVIVTGERNTFDENKEISYLFLSQHLIRKVWCGIQLRTFRK